MEKLTDLTKVTQQISGKVKTKEEVLPRKQICGCQGEGVGGWMEWEVGVSRCKLL